MASAPIRLDGSEGSGQLLRTALTLSLITQVPFSIERFGARRGASGLRPEQLGCVRAARAVSGAEVSGAELGAKELVFEPGPLRPGTYLLEAGSIPQAIQTVAIPLSTCAESSALTLRGATHLPGAPTLHYVQLIWGPAVQELGYRIEVELCAAGFGPEGGGEVKVQVRPQVRAAGLDRRGRGTLREARVLSAISNVPLERANRQSARALQRLRERGILAQAETLPIPAPRSAGSMCLVAGAFERGAAGFHAVGEASADPERMADEAAAAFLDFMSGRGAVDEHLADQLLVPTAISAAGLSGWPPAISRFTTPRATEQLLSTAAVVERFLEVEVAILTGPDGEAELRVAPRGESLIAALRAGRVPRG
jgi:RNA 3'-terminal phosphate cyclase (ATP)